MKIRSLCALGKMRAYTTDHEFAILSPKAFSIPAGVDPLEHEAEALHAFIQRNRWRHPNCIVGLHNSHNQLLAPGEIVMSGTRSSLIRYLLRWEALRIIPVWVDGFSSLSVYERDARSKQLEQLESARRRLVATDSWYQNDEDQYELACMVMRTGHWALENLPPLDGLRWPTGETLGLSNPSMSAEAVEDGFLEGIFSMIERGARFHGEAGSIPANKLFGIELMSPRSGYELLVKLHIQIETNRAEAAHARRHRAIA
ncbi:hypothetical protein ACLPJF_21515 [Pseudomonas vlassakiae]|uniref:hypothetical protein n=1 Tax=Pseudomonas TaxID=286 RepID=UPI001C253052|nr:hypothetical protein [Pseudomonas shirazica]